MMNLKFDTLNDHDLDTVTGGSILNNVGIGTSIGAIGGIPGMIAGGAIAAAGSMGYEAEKKGNNPTKWDWL
jgi:bacteriocin-like protein